MKEYYKIISFIFIGLILLIGLLGFFGMQKLESSIPFTFSCIAIFGIAWILTTIFDRIEKLENKKGEEEK